MRYCSGGGLVAEGRATVRFAVGKPEGPRAHVWLLWTSKNRSDVYITGYGFRRTLKVSLHESGKWRQAFTQEHVSGPSPFVPPDEDRTMDKWERPPEFAPGVTKAFEVLVPASEVTMPRQSGVKPDWEGKDVLWVTSPPEDFAVYFTVVYTAPHIIQKNLEITWKTADGLHSYTSRSIWRSELPNGQSVWVVVHNRPIFEEEKEQLKRFKQQWIAAIKQAMGDDKFSSMVEPRSYFAGYDADGTRFFIDISSVPLED